MLSIMLQKLFPGSYLIIIIIGVLKGEILSIVLFVQIVIS